jgi:hypothetical protein
VTLGLVYNLEVYVAAGRWLSEDGIDTDQFREHVEYVINTSVA